MLYATLGVVLAYPASSLSAPWACRDSFFTHFGQDVSDSSGTSMSSVSNGASRHSSTFSGSSTVSRSSVDFVEGVYNST